MLNPEIDEYIARAKNWQQEMEYLRSILLSCHLDEEFKWRVPCYTYQGKKFIIIGQFKEYCTLSFLKAFY